MPPTCSASSRAAIGQAMVGQAEVVEQVLVALVASGHVLIEGVPGLGKTLLVRALAQALSLPHARVQFTPDMMPSDITGHAVLDPSTRELRVRARPGVHAHAAGRRDQSRAGQDAERAARGDAGIPGDARRADAAAAEAVHGAGDAEPGRDRRHVSAARGAARPLPVQDRDRLSVARRGSRRRRARDRRPGRRRAAAGGREPRARRARRAQPAAARGAVSASTSRSIDYAVRIVRATRDWPGLAVGSGLARRASRWCAARAPPRCSTAATT